MTLALSNATEARNVRNKNPGNIRRTAAEWDGEIEGNDPAFETFDTAASGFRALAKILMRYQSDYGLDTIAMILNRFAPPSENDTDAYIRDVSRKTGLGMDDKLPRFRDHPSTLVDLCMAIAHHEGGRWNRDEAVQGVNRALQATARA
jgi:hypothetical protein